MRIWGGAGGKRGTTMVLGILMCLWRLVCRGRQEEGYREGDEGVEMKSW
jgi:hypothetical protein